jgi:heme-degrading monooxygenase HmoA
MSDARIATTPEPPYWVVMFTSRHSGADRDAYERMGDAMVALAAKQPGFLGVESTRDAEGVGITLSYWASEQAIHDWKRVAAHAEAQRLGHERWYEDFALRVARVERAYTKATSERAGLTAAEPATPRAPRPRARA